MHNTAFLYDDLLKRIIGKVVLKNFQPCHTNQTWQYALYGVDIRLG